MRHLGLASALAFAVIAAPSFAQQSGPYKVIKSVVVGGEGGWDYISADADGRRLYIPRGASKAEPATATSPAQPAVPERVTVFDLNTLAPIGEIPNVGGHGVVVDSKSGHGFVSGNPVSMFDTQTLKVVKQIDVGDARSDGILYDASNQRVYIFSHPTKNATVIDAKTGDVLGTIDLGGVPEEGVVDGHGRLYVVMQDQQGGVAVADVNTMKTTTHYSFGDIGRCNGLALDDAHHVLFAACGSSGTTAPGQPAQPTMVIMSATDGKIITTLPLAGGSDGMAFNPATQEAFATLGNGILQVVKENSPTSFTQEQNLTTMNGARTITLDRQTGHIFTMSNEYGPMPAQPAPTAEPAGGRGGRGGFRRPPVIPGSFTILMIGK